MTDEEKIIDRSMVFRGAIIHEVSVFERFLDLHIANYFCKSQETVTDFIELVLGGNRISLDGKRKIFESIIKRASLTPYKGFATDMNTMLYERNNFAHCTLAFGTEALEKKDTHVGLMKISASTHVDWYDQPRVTEIILIIRRCVGYLKKLME